MRIEVVYALPDEQVVITLEVASGTTAIEAVRRAGVLERYPQLRDRDLDLGIYAEPVAHTHVLAPDDRVEIYRELLVDPRDARRQRLKQSRTGRPRR